MSFEAHDRLMRMHQALRVQAIIQAMLLLITSLILDTGRVFTYTLFIVTSYWLLVAIIYLRHRNNLSKFDVAVSTFGFPLVAVLIIPAVWLWHLVA